MLLSFDCTFKSTTKTSSIMLWRSVCFLSLCCLHKGPKVKCQERSQFGQQKTAFTPLVLFCPHNSLPLFSSPLPSLEYAPAGGNEETPPPSPVEEVQTLTPLHRPSFVDSPSPSSLSINIHCSSNNTARHVWLDGRGTHFNSRKLSHPLLEVISNRMIDVD